MIEHSEPDGQFVLCYGGLRIPFRVMYRRRKSLAITVHPDLRVEVAAPEGTTTEQVIQRVEKRASWIQFEQQHLIVAPGNLGHGARWPASR